MRGYINIYRSGHFHRCGKPLTYDRHGGDIYDTEEQAVQDINPRSHYIATVPVFWHEPDEGLAVNAPDSKPVPLSETRSNRSSEALLDVIVDILRPDTRLQLDPGYEAWLRQQKPAR